ncbi:NACHT, LRR and PYD domains-containing protein 5-like [Hemitrygon akajei]|uniref:NACHT, LRR and PYD domains-containing protein 5-like n=1 Tax=Hemitrygon akajei TaxID=2704970 RepID=UPI003BF9C79C
MATDDKLNWLRKVFGRVLPGRSSREVDREAGNNVPKQGQIESNVPVECSSATEEGEQSQPRESGVRDTDQGHATGTCEATACQLASSLNTELSSPQQGNDTKPIISDVLAQFEDYELLLLTNFYQEGLKPAMENGVDGLSLKLRQGRHFSESEHKEVTELVEMGKRTESCKLFLSLVKEKGAQARRVMWESFVEMRKKLPKVEKILMEIQELGPDPYEHMDITRSFYELSSHLKGLSSPMTTPCLEDILGPFPHETTLRVIEWVKEEFNRQIESTSSVDGKRCLLKTLLYLFESQNRGLAQDTLGSVETLSFSGMTLTPIDCAVLSHVIGLCDTIKHLDLWNCRIQCEGIHRLEPGLHKCQKLRLGWNTLGDSGAKLVFQSLKNPACKIQKLWLERVGFTDSGANDLVSALSTNRSLTELDVSGNKLGDLGVKLVSAALRNPECKIQKLVLIEVGLTDSGTRDLATTLSTNRSVMALDLNKNRLGDSGVKLVSAALRNPECKIQKLGLNCVGLTDSGADDILSALITNQTLTGLDLGLNSLTDRSIPALRRLILTRRSLEWIWLVRNQFSETGRMKLQESRPTLRVIL